MKKARLKEDEIAAISLKAAQGEDKTLRPSRQMKRETATQSFIIGVVKGKDE